MTAAMPRRCRSSTAPRRLADPTPRRSRRRARRFASACKTNRDSPYFLAGDLDDVAHVVEYSVLVRSLAVPPGAVFGTPKARVDPADALLERRMSGEAPPARNRLGEEHVRQ